jgi:hypothetical protein
MAVSLKADDRQMLKCTYDTYDKQTVINYHKFYKI